MMPDDRVMEAFGKLNPTTSERTAFFFDSWISSRANRMYIAQGKVKTFELYCCQSGLKKFWDFQIKGSEVRFVHATDFAMIKLGWDNNG